MAKSLERLRKVCHCYSNLFLFFDNVLVNSKSAFYINVTFLNLETPYNYDSGYLIYILHASCLTLMCLMVMLLLLSTSSHVSFSTELN